MQAATHNPNVIADSKHRHARQYEAAPVPPTGFGAIDVGLTVEEKADRLERDADTAADWIYGHCLATDLQVLPVYIGRDAADVQDVVDTATVPQLLCLVMHHPRADVRAAAGAELGIRFIAHGVTS